MGIDYRRVVKCLDSALTIVQIQLAFFRAGGYKARPLEKLEGEVVECREMVGREGELDENDSKRPLLSP